MTVALMVQMLGWVGSAADDNNVVLHPLEAKLEVTFASALDFKFAKEHKCEGFNFFKHLLSKLSPLMY